MLPWNEGVRCKRDSPRLESNFVLFSQPISGMPLRLQGQPAKHSESGQYEEQGCGMAEIHVTCRRCRVLKWDQLTETRSDVSCDVDTNGTHGISRYLRSGR